MRFTIAAIMALTVAGVKIHENEQPQKDGRHGKEGPHDEEGPDYVEMEKDGRRIFGAIDTNEDGKMDKNEFQGAIDQFEKWDVIDDEQAKGIKAHWDEHMGDGETLDFEAAGEALMDLLGPEKLEQMIEKVENAAVRAVAEHIFTTSDTDNSGTVSYKEFVKFGEA